MYVTYLFALAGPRVAKHEKETTRACVHSLVPENGNRKIKTKREYRTVRSVHCPFNTRSPSFFFKRVTVVWIERGNFFLTPTVSDLRYTL